MRRFSGAWAMILILTMIGPIALAQNVPAANQAKGAFNTGMYRNLFKENGHPEKLINAKLNTAFRQLFYGDSLTQAIYYNAGKNADGKLAYICDVLHQDIRSEGMSYGMMIAVQLNKKVVFDALWNYALSYMYIHDANHPGHGYFAWSVKRDGTPNAEGPAPDGEEYIVTALYFASARWPNGKNNYNYKSWADKILVNMRHHPLTSGMTAFGIQTTGSMVNEQKKLILFVPNSKGRSFSDPSYHLPAFYEVWARCGPAADRSFWAAAADSSRAYFRKAANQATGLCADYADLEGQPVVTAFNPDSHNFAYDSWRTAMNWSVDWAWWHKDSSEPVRSSKVLSFFARQGMKSYGSIYTIDGKMLSSSHTVGLVAANATLGLASPSPQAKDFVEALWEQQVPDALGERYYGGLLHLMALLHCSGKFRAYLPR